MNTCYVLVGLPGVGKSTWVKMNAERYDVKPFGILSTDNTIEKIAISCGMTYNDIFDLAFPIAKRALNNQIKGFKLSEENVMIDQTNLTVSSRRSKLSIFPKHRKVAIVFDKPEDDLWRVMLNRPGKTIPEYVLTDMEKRYVAPTESEGFDDIINVGPRSN